MIEQYKNIGGNSGIEMYEIGQDYIKIWFLGCEQVYTYDNKSAGEQNIKIAKELAAKGQGLNSFIMRNIKDKYMKKESRYE